jgi:glutathione peroxidase
MEHHSLISTHINYRANNPHGFLLRKDRAGVNNASKCGLTPSLKVETCTGNIWLKEWSYWGFPELQFATGAGDEKSHFGRHLFELGVTFPMFSKVDVNGGSAHPLLKY